MNFFFFIKHFLLLLQRKFFSFIFVYMMNMYCIIIFKWNGKILRLRFRIWDFENQDHFPD